MKVSRLVGLSFVSNPTDLVEKLLNNVPKSHENQNSCMLACFLSFDNGHVLLGK